jgi:hypothetical protein
MIEDINIPEIKNVTVVIKPEDKLWSVHLINANSFPIENILVAAKGYGKKEPEREETGTLRHFYDKLDENASLQIELIDPKVFHLFNEYGVTYYIHDEIYFKKFVFVPDSITEENLMDNEILGTSAVTHS